MESKGTARRMYGIEGWFFKKLSEIREQYYNFGQALTLTSLVARVGPRTFRVILY